MFRSSLMLLGALLICAQPVSAATVLRFGTTELAKHADVIVHGKVLKMKSRLAKKTGNVVTDYEVVVYEALKGMGSARYFKFTAFGGVVVGKGSAISGAPKYHLNEEVLVFLSKRNKYGWRQAIGLAQGKYMVRKVEGKKLAFRDLEGLRLMDRKTGVIEHAHKGHKKEQGVLFTELLAQVKQELRRLKAEQAKSKKKKNG